MASTGVDLPNSKLQEEKPQYYDNEAALRNSDEGLAKVSFDSTHRQLRPRHIQLIGIGGTIGTALYVSIGHGLINGGPGSLFLAFTIWYVVNLLKFTRNC
jgi:amino acid transporter